MRARFIVRGSELVEVTGDELDRELAREAGERERHTHGRINVTDLRTVPELDLRGDTGTGVYL